MWPTLVAIGPLAFHSFGVVLGLGVFWGGFVLWQKGREEGFEEVALMDGWLVGLITGRIGEVLLNWGEFSGSIYRMLFFTKFPGLAYEGVLLGAVITLAVFGLKQKWNVWRFLETAVPALLVVEMAGWLGAFLAGSNLGKVTEFAWGINFPGVEGARFPVQLAAVLLLYIWYRLMAHWEKEYRSFGWYQTDKGEARPGFMVAAYLAGLGGIRLGLGFLAVERHWQFDLGLLIFSGLLLIWRSGITIHVKTQTEKLKVAADQGVKRDRKRERQFRKKQGFDFK